MIAFIIVFPFSERNVSESSDTSGYVALCLSVWDEDRGQTSQSVDLRAVRLPHAFILPVTTAHSLSPSGLGVPCEWACDVLEEEEEEEDSIVVFLTQVQPRCV